MDKQIMAGANSQNEKFFFGPSYSDMPDSIKDEIKIICVSMAEKLESTFIMGFHEDGDVFFEIIKPEDCIDFDDIDIQVDNEKKEIQVHIPNVDITKIDVDIASMEFIFYDENENTSTVTETAYKACQADAQKESQKQQAIYDLAKQNASNVLTALIQPIVEQVDAEYDLVVS